MKKRQVTAQTRMVRLAAELRSWEAVIGLAKDKELRDFAEKSIESISDQLVGVARVVMVTANLVSGPFTSPEDDEARHACREVTA